MIVSDRALEVARTTPNRGYVLDMVEWYDRAVTYQTPMTVADLTPTLPLCAFKRNA